MYKTFILLAVTSLFFSACQKQPEPSKVQYKMPVELEHSFYNKLNF